MAERHRAWAQWIERLIDEYERKGRCLRTGIMELMVLAYQSGLRDAEASEAVLSERARLVAMLLPTCRYNGVPSPDALEEAIKLAETIVESVKEKHGKSTPRPPSSP